MPPDSLLTEDPKTELDVIARKHCEKLLSSKAAKEFGPAAEALIIIAFTYGAAWALDCPDMIELGDAQIDANRALHAGKVS